MQEITQEELNVIIANHQHYLNRDCEGWWNMKADLSDCDCRCLNFDGAKLKEAVLDRASLDHASLDHASLDWASFKDATLDGASLDHASLDWASFKDATLDGASLVGASLYGALLDDASLYGATLDGASLDHATLYGALLVGASLIGAKLKGALLGEATLDGATLDDATLVGASLYCASLVGVKGLSVPLACPSEGEFIAYKKCGDRRLVKLLIPADARRSSATTDKCRADKAVVLEITSLDGREQYDEATSMHDSNFIYHVGETVSVPDFDENRFNECSTGIHFFTDKQVAKAYI